MKQLLKHVMSFEDVNWWMLAGGMALNVGIAAIATILGAYWSLSETTAEFYALYGPPMLLGVFVATLLTGALVSRMAYQVPIRHAFFQPAQRGPCIWSRDRAQLYASDAGPGGCAGKRQWRHVGSAETSPEVVAGGGGFCRIVDACYTCASAPLAQWIEHQPELVAGVRVA